MIGTSLYEKLFIDGFEKPSYVVVTIMLERAPFEAAFSVALRRALAQNPRLRCVVRMRLGIPFAFVPFAADRFSAVTVHRAPVDLRALEERLLSEPLDLRRTAPLEVHLLHEPPAIVLKIHHAVIDASSGFAVLRDFARALEGAALERASFRSRSRARRAREWLARLQLRPRLPGTSVVASFRPTAPLERAPVEYRERLLSAAHARIARRARARGATFSELVASALLCAMARYNAARTESPPAKLGLMIARARPRRPTADAAFRADTCVVRLPERALDPPHQPATLAELRRRANEDRHNDLALAALYARRKLQRRRATPTEHTGLSFTLSDLTAFGRVLAGTRSALSITGVRVLASPTSFDHAGMLVTRIGDDVRLSVVSHRGALDADALLDSLLTNLEER